MFLKVEFVTGSGKPKYAHVKVFRSLQGQHSISSIQDNKSRVASLDFF